MQKRGFTLIELLAVIIILAIIALISIPTITNIVERAGMSAFKDSAYGVIKSGELYYAEQMMSAEGMTTDKIFTFPDNIIGLELKGSRPTNGTLKVTKEGKIIMAIHNGKYCIKKAITDDDISIDENIEECGLPRELVQNPHITLQTLVY